MFGWLGGFPIARLLERRRFYDRTLVVGADRTASETEHGQSN
jgi:hypothetical protein